ncbi:MAG: translational GTPase TypA [Bdellovibrionaceae bacterium]|nr:translational GTPase TypA [Pseudobdellovibrionaceae bacterium]
MEIRNIAIIAHVDHGKTTLVDHLLKQSGMFRDNEHVEERMMDSMDLERERGITIAAKNASFEYKGVKVNIVDTPGHSDFGGEVERILDMVDGAILLVDSSEGPLPQTRFVLKKALEQNKKIILCINKIDRKDARADEVLNEAFDLFIELDATEEQADFKTVYAIAREGKASLQLEDVTEQTDLSVLFDLILSEVPPPKVEDGQPFRMLVTNIGYNSYVGRLAIGRIQSGTIETGARVNIHQADGKKAFKITALFTYNRNQQVETQKLTAGDIAIVAGFEDLQIGDTIAALEVETPLPRINVDEPTVGIFISVNNGPFAGKEGDHVTSRKIKERLERELLTNVSLRLEDTGSPETFKLIARGELQIAVLLEQMRREGYEVLVSQPQVIMRSENGVQLEPFDLAYIDAEDLYMGSVTQKLQQRKGILVEMNTKGTGRTTAVFRIPSRGLIGYRSEFLTDTRGTGLLNTQYDGYDEYRGEIQKRFNGRMVSDRQGKATGYALFNLEDRGSMFVTPGTDVYKGMIIGDYNKGSELSVNVCREKKLTNIRASGSDENIKLTRVKPLSIESALEWIDQDELIEITPKSLRLRLRSIQ